MEIAVPAVIAVVAEPLRWAWKGAKKQYSYCTKYKKSAEAFESEAIDFVKRSEELHQIQLDHKANDVKNKVNQLRRDIAEARSGCLSHYKLSKRIAKLTKAMVQLLHDPKFVSLQPQAAIIRPRSRIERPQDFLSFTSRKLSVDSIMNALKDEGRSIVRVYGMGGVGKTYMVKALASRAIKERMFHQVVVSVVSQTVDLRKIQGDIAHGLGVELTSSEVQDRADDLRNVLNDQGNILLILDDLWQTIDLSDIGIPQYSEDMQSCKCKILITTRQMHVCDDLDRRPAIKINVLSGDDPWILFSQKAGDIVKQPDFIDIGKKIVEECAGLPIALSTVGSALRNKDLGSWRSAATRINTSVVKAGMALANWPRDTLTSSCGAISLMSNHLKQLPHGVDCPGIETLLLQDNKNLMLVPDEFFQGMRTLKVLDFTGVKFKSLPSSTQQLSLLRVLSMDNCRFLKDVSMIGELNKLEILTLRLSGIGSLPESFANLKELRILDITLSLRCENVPSGVISSMNKLEELYMQGCFADWENGNGQNKASFQEVLTLSGLTILKVDIIDVQCLPPSISVAPNWEKFDICVSGSQQRRLANATKGASFFRGLATGVKLEVFPNWFRQAVARKAEKLSYQLCESLSNILEEYHHGNFDGVKFLYIDQCADIAQLIKLGNGLPDKPVFPQLEKLNIHHMQKTEGICTEELPLGSLQKVKTLEVGECPNLKDSLLPPNLIQRMPNLENVQVIGSSIKAVFGFEGITVQGGQLRKLKRLTLQNLPQLTSLWKGHSEIVMFHRLEVVKVSKCENLRYIFPYTVCDYLCHLEELWLEDCSSLEKVIGGHKDHEVPESISLPRLSTLTLRLLPRLTDFYAQEAYLCCPELQRLHKQDCQRLRTNLSDFHSDQEIQEKRS
ncbi:hypothetical protein RND71_016345 [Anisodus tanguticus]|uniref:AAA+ ATPase domain-containing protein n=1 Tax=Anisodus tanguticus TaxID=243964 RepID=A0AAE1VDP6_9SOLA|nr:hypothetical protein RND71_016345 [Anisodus tanguticus]